MTIFQCYYLSPVHSHFNLLLKDFLELQITNVKKINRKIATITCFRINIFSILRNKKYFRLNHVSLKLEQRKTIHLLHNYKYEVLILFFLSVANKTLENWQKVECHLFKFWIWLLVNTCLIFLTSNDLAATKILFFK